MDEPGSTTSGGQQLAPLLLSVLASVCGTLIAAAFEQTTPELHLLGAALGAAVPPLLAVVGPYTQLRAAAAVLVTVAALGVTYGGVTLSEVAAGSSERTFPVPEALAQQERAPTGSTSSPEAEVEPEELCRGEQCVAWAPATLRCSASSCDGPVRVSNTGTAPVSLREIHFHETAEGAFERGGTCAPGQVLQPGDECEVEVVPSDSGETAAVLEVHQDLPGPSSVVRIVRTTGGPEGDAVHLALEGPVACGPIVAAGGADGGDRLTLSATVLAEGAGPDPVLVQLVGDAGISAETTTVLDTRTPVDLDVTLLPEHYGRQLAMTLTVDPADEVPDEDDVDDELRVTVTTPPGPGAGQVECS